MAQRSLSPAATAARPAATPGRATPSSTGRRIGQRVGAAALLAIAAPLIAVMALLTRLTSPGTAFFRQVRVGLAGRRFVIIKIRTMNDGAELIRPGAWTLAEDPRITPLGTVLRRWHFDELPQLVNVVRGDMALVGPRPERPEIAAQLQLVIPEYDRRLEVLPGIVGLAQINLPPDRDIDCVRKKLALDLEYIRTAGPGLDTRMLAWSVLRLVGVPFAPATRRLGLERPVETAQLRPVQGLEARHRPGDDQRREPDVGATRPRDGADSGEAPRRTDAA